MDNDQLAYVFMMLFFLALCGVGAGGTMLVLKIVARKAWR